MIAYTVRCPECGVPQYGYAGSCTCCNCKHEFTINDLTINQLEETMDTSIKVSIASLREGMRLALEADPNWAYGYLATIAGRIVDEGVDYATAINAAVSIMKDMYNVDTPKQAKELLQRYEPTTTPEPPVSDEELERAESLVRIYDSFKRSIETMKALTPEELREYGKQLKDYAVKSDKQQRPDGLIVDIYEYEDLDEESKDCCGEEAKGKVGRPTGHR